MADRDESRFRERERTIGEPAATQELIEQDAAGRRRSGTAKDRDAAGRSTQTAERGFYRENPGSDREDYELWRSHGDFRSPAAARAARRRYDRGARR